MDREKLVLHCKALFYSKLMSILNEENLWESFKRGNEQSFASIYATYFSVLYAYGYHIAKDEELVKDCIQTLFVELWNGRQNLSNTTSIKYYLLKAMRRQVYHAIRKKQAPLLPIIALSDTYDFEVSFSPEFDLIAHQTTAEQRQKLMQAIEKLSNRQKEAITLLYIEGLSYPEISDIMVLKTRSVYNLIHTALEVLKTHFAHHKLWLLLTALIAY